MHNRLIVHRIWSCFFFCEHRDLFEIWPGPLSVRMGMGVRVWDGRPTDRPSRRCLSTRNVISRAPATQQNNHHLSYTHVYCKIQIGPRWVQSQVHPRYKYCITSIILSLFPFCSPGSRCSTCGLWGASSGIAIAAAPSSPRDGF